MLSTVWVFCAEGEIIPSGVFTGEKVAEDWIRKHSLTGTLAEYPLDLGLYEWAISRGHFKPKYPSHETPKFIGGFKSAYLRHSHFENGMKVA